MKKKGHKFMMHGGDVDITLVIGVAGSDKTEELRASGGLDRIVGEMGLGGKE